MEASVPCDKVCGISDHFRSNSYIWPGDKDEHHAMPDETDTATNTGNLVQIAMVNNYMWRHFVKLATENECFIHIVLCRIQQP